MKYLLLVLLSFLQLVANNIDITKEAVYLGYVDRFVDTKKIVTQYNKNDIYIYKTQRNGGFGYDIYLVNIEQEDLKYFLRKARQSNSTSKHLSKIKLKYFARDNSNENIFITNKKIINNTTISINQNKKAIFLSSMQDMKDAKRLASRYKKYDIYIYNTLRNNIEFYDIYIVNIENTKVKSLLVKLNEDLESVKEVSKIKVKYFAQDRSSSNKLIASKS
jgi:hypothetical protein